MPQRKPYALLFVLPIVLLALVWTQPTEGSEPTSKEELTFIEQSGVETDATSVEDAEACDTGNWEACFRTANRYEMGMFAPSAPTRAIALYKRGCSAEHGASCRMLGMHLCGTSGLLPKKPDAARMEKGRAALASACDLGFLDSCATLGGLLIREGIDQDGALLDKTAAVRGAELLARACQGGYHVGCSELRGWTYGIETAGLVPPIVTPLAPGEGSTPTPLQVCPATFYFSMRQDGGPKLRGGLPAIAKDDFVALLPSTLGSWSRHEEWSGQAGEAGRRTSTASAQYKKDKIEVTVGLIDLAADCTLQPGTGRAMAAHSAKRVPNSEARTVDGREFVILPAEANSSVIVWSGDRCIVSATTASPAKGEVLADLLKELDLEAIDALCAGRGGGLY